MLLIFVDGVGASGGGPVNVLMGVKFRVICYRLLHSFSLNHLILRLQRRGSAIRIHLHDHLHGGLHGVLGAAGGGKQKPFPPLPGAPGKTVQTYRYIV